ncbi:MAG: protein kinase [Elusimicrobia bacterium]|nr:protein kinase [Elusimicrobiota bacterium]
MNRRLLLACLMLAWAGTARAECSRKAYTEMKDCEVTAAGSHVVKNPDGTQTTVADYDSSACLRLVGDVADECGEAYDKALEVLKTAKTEAEISASEAKLKEIADIVKDVKTIKGVTQDPKNPLMPLSELAELDTSVIPDAVNAAKERLKAPSVGGTPDPNAVPGPALPPVQQVRDLIEDGDTAAALDKLDGLIGPGTQDPDLFSMRSWGLARSGDRAAALRDAEAALQLDPKNELAGQVKAYLESAGSMGKSRVELKAPDFSGLSSSKGKDSSAWLQEGGAPSGGEWMWGSGGAGAPPRPGGAAAQAAGAVGPAEPLLKSSMAKFRVGDLNGALLDATRALQADKSDLRARAIRAAVANRQKNHEGALWEAGEILKTHPNNVPAYLEKSLAEYGLLQYDAALADVATASKLDPSNALARVYEGMILEKTGRDAEAFAAYERAAGLDSGMARCLADARSRLEPGEAPQGFDWKRLARWGGPVGLALAFVITGAWWRSSGPGAAAAGAGTAPQSFPARAAEGLRTSAATVAQAPEGALLAGTYRVVRELGSGGMGEVYEAVDEKLQRSVALKRLKRQAYASPELRDRFLKEARLVAKLRHPHLAEIFTVAGDEELYLVFELVQGEALDKTLSRRGRLGLDEAQRIVGEVCSALEYAHDEHVIHRDLKPSNIMFDGEGRAKVMDFGIAHEARGSADLTQTAAWGTPPYMAPEQEGGRVGRESDLYALAVMAYEMLTGSRPFPGPYFLEKKLKKQYPAPTAVNGTLPRSVDAFFAKALEPEPEKRYRTAAEFAAAFRGLA